jgi:Xaa-Pro aminopeptidase
MRKLLAVLFVLTSLSFALERQPNDAYAKRRHALADKAGAAVLLFAPTESEGPNAVYGFRQEDNFYYLTGLTDPGAAVLIAPPSKQGDTPSHGYVEVLFLPGRNVTQEKWTGPKLTAETSDAAQKTGFERVASLDTLRDQLLKILPQPRATVYSDLDFESASHGPIEWLRRANAFPNYISFQEVKPLIAEMRLIKDAGEIALIKKATDASVSAHLEAMHQMKPGMREQEISAAMQYEFLRRGCERPAYAPIVGSGFYGTVLHYSKNENTIKDGDVVVMDVGGEYSMYASDITRTLPANGKFTPRQREIYDIVYGAQQAAIAAFKPGVSTRATLKQVAMDYINSHGKDKHGQTLGQYFIHGLSHAIGLNVHDPGPDIPLKPGRVFSNEPGIYIPEESLGVRIEDVMLVGEDGKLINLSGALPSKAEDVEREIAKGASTAGAR